MVLKKLVVHHSLVNVNKEIINSILQKTMGHFSVAILGNVLFWLFVTYSHIETTPIS